MADVEKPPVAAKPEVKVTVTSTPQQETPVQRAQRLGYWGDPRK